MPDTSTADEDLVARARDGDVEAYAVLIQRYQPLAVGLAGLIMRNSAEADDVAQEAFLKAYYALDRFRPGASFKPWLVRIVVNEARNAAASARRRLDLYARFRAEAPGLAMSVSAEDSASANEQQSAVLAALDQLRDDDRDVLMFRYVFDLSEAEMAAALACSPGTVKSRLSRALARLRADLTRVAPLLVVSPSFGALLGQTLSGAASPPGVAASALVKSVLDRIASGAAPGGALAGHGKPTIHQMAAGAAGVVAVLAVATTGFLMSRSDTPTTPLPSVQATRPGPAVALAATQVSSPVPTPAPVTSVPRTPVPTLGVFVVYGGDLTDAQREELSRTLAPGAQASIDSISRDELVSSLTASGMAVDGTERAISSAQVTCLGQGQGLGVRTRNVTQLPAAVYANALVSAGVADADVTVAAPPSAPMTGETALVGVLKAYPHCHAGQPLPPERLRVAEDEIRVTAELAQTSGAWDRAANVMLRAAQSAISSRAADEALLAAALDEAATEQGITLDPRQHSEIVSVLNQLAALDHGAYTAGYTIQQSAPDDVHVTPKAATP